MYMTGPFPTQEFRTESISGPTGTERVRVYWMGELVAVVLGTPCAAGAAGVHAHAAVIGLSLLYGSMEAKEWARKEIAEVHKYGD